MLRPLVSVTITNYNYANYIAQALNSVLQQTFQDFEIIVVDNASTDNSIEIIQEFMRRDRRIRLIAHTKNMGGQYSLIEACREARGKYRVQIDADDWIKDPQAFELQVAMLERRPDMAFVYSDVVVHDGQNQPQFSIAAYPYDIILPGEQAVEDIMTTMAHSGVMLRLDSYRAVGGYDQRYKYADDLKLYMDLCLQGSVGYIRRELYINRQHAKGSMARSGAKIYHETILVLEEMFRGPLRTRIANVRALRSRILRNALTAFATPLIFGDQYRFGWQVYWENVKINPYLTIFQRRSIVLLLRTLLGQTKYDQLRSLARRAVRSLPLKRPATV
jgi:glycosyltransferase involved in cell wall biosynthesis